MPMPKIDPEINKRIKEIWAEDPSRSGQDVWNLLQQEPIKCPSLRKVQQIVGEAKRNHPPLEPEVTIEPWQHEWFEDPDKVKILLSMIHAKSDEKEPRSQPLTEREAKWGLRIGTFFELSSRDEARWLLTIASMYAELERTSLLLNSDLNTSKLDSVLLMKSGVSVSEFPASAEPNAEVIGDWADALQMIASDSSDSTTAASKSDLPLVASMELVDLWNQLDSELALIDRQRFNALGYAKSNGNPNWDNSQGKAVFDAREREIQELANKLYATPEGHAAYEQFHDQSGIGQSLRILEKSPS